MSNHKYSLYSIIILGIINFLSNHICKYENQNGYEKE